MANKLGRIPLRERVRELERIYGVIEREMAREMASMDIGNYRELRAIRTQEKIDGLVKMLNRATIKWSKATVPEAYERGYAVAKTRLEILGVERDEEFPEKTHAQTIEYEIDVTMDVLIKANQSIKMNVAIFIYLARAAARGLSQFQAFDMRDEQVIDELLGDALRAGETRAYAAKAVREHFAERFGDAKFITINGRDYNLRKYADLVAKTRLRVVQSEAVKNSCKEYENDLIQISAHGTDCLICIPYEGNVYSISGKHPVYPYLDGWPPYHPRCQHNAMPTSEVALEWRRREEMPFAPEPYYEPLPRKPVEIKERIRWKPAKSLAEAEKWGKQYGIEILHDAGKKVDLKYINAVNKEMSKIPENVLLRIKNNKGALHMVANNGVTIHPIFRSLKGQKPRGWTTGSWDTVPGAGGTVGNPITVIVANKTGIGHGSINLTLHEYGHTVDAVYSKGWKSLSDSSSWKKIWKTNGNKGLIRTPYQSMYAEEYWAESFAEYFNTSGHGFLPKNVITYFNNLVKGGGG